MELSDGRITILVSEETTRIELRDGEADTTFARVELTSNQFCQALSRLSQTKCKMDVRGLDVIGKKMVHKKFEFKMPKFNYSNREQAACDAVQEKCPDGWEPDLYFNAQNSFFIRDETEYARTTIRRWV